MPHIVMAELTALQGKDEELARRIADLAGAVRREAGNEGFEVFTRPGVEGGWLMLERYRDKDAFERHLGMTHTKAFNEALRALVEGGLPTVTDLAVAIEPHDAGPGIRGIDHVGVTVPDIEGASTFLEEAFGARRLYDVLPAGADPMEGEETERQLGLAEGAKIVHMRLMRIGASATIELFQVESAVRGEAAGIDGIDGIGLQHIAIYVDDMAAATARFRAAGGELLSDPHPLAGVEAGDGNVGVYGRAPWGMLIELIHTPAGIDYPGDCPFPRWKPHPIL